MTQPERDPGETAPFTSPINRPWAFYGDLNERALSSVALGDQDEWERQLWRASELLYALSGRQWRCDGGERTIVVRSVRPRPADGLDWPYSRSWGICRCWGWSSMGGDNVPMPAEGYLGQHHQGAPSIMMPDRDATRIEAVTLDGQPFTRWRFDASSGYLHRTDGGRWPVCRDRLEIAYRYGDNPPQAGVAHAADLAVDFARYVVGDEKCRLPSRITSLTRQAIAMTFASPEEVAKSRLTGIPAVDSWITSVNPYLRPAEAMVVSPDVPTARS